MSTTLEAPQPLSAVLTNSENAENAEEWTDLESHRQLYVSIIQLAIKDYEFLKRIADQESLSPSERKKLRGLTEDSDPVEFFNSGWFEDICNMIGVQPKAIRERLEVEGAESLLPQVLA